MFNIVAKNKSKVVQRCLYSYRQRYLSSQWSKFVVDSRGAQHFDHSVMTNIVVNKSTDNAEPLLINFVNNFLLTEREGRTGEYWPEVVHPARSVKWHYGRIMPYNSVTTSQSERTYYCSHIIIRLN